MTELRQVYSLQRKSNQIRPTSAIKSIPAPSLLLSARRNTGKLFRPKSDAIIVSLAQGLRFSPSLDKQRQSTDGYAACATKVSPFVQMLQQPLRFASDRAMTDFLESPKNAPTGLKVNEPVPSKLLLLNPHSAYQSTLGPVVATFHNTS
jgi:hypothetical protein